MTLSFTKTIQSVVWGGTEEVLHVRVRTHPQVVHSLADPAELLGDFLLKVLIEAGLHREHLGNRWPVVLFSWQTKISQFDYSEWCVDSYSSYIYIYTHHIFHLQLLKTSAASYLQCSLCLRSCSLDPAPSGPAQLLSSPAPPAVWSG